MIKQMFCGNKIKLNWFENLKKKTNKSKNLMVNTKLTAKQLEETANG